MDLGNIFDSTVARQPASLAFIDGCLRREFSSWQLDVRRIACGISKLGLRKGDRLLCITENSYEMATLYWACQMLAAIFTPFNWRATAEDIKFVLEDATPRVIAYDHNARETIATLKNKIDASVVYIGKNETGFNFNELLHEKPLSGPYGAVDGDTCLMLYTSGTTGRPKGVPRSHLAERTAGVSVIAHLRYQFGDVALGVMPMFHTMGIRLLLCSSMINGAFINMGGFDAKDALQIIKKEKVNTLFLVPTMFHDILMQDSFETTSMTSVRNVAYAGMSMTSELERRCIEKIQPEIFANYYGSSEIFTFTFCDHLDKKPGSAGLPGLNQVVKVVRADSKKLVEPEEVTEPGEIGEVIASMQSPEAFSGYWKRPDADEKAIRGDWYFTGDLGYLDEDGELFLSGRVDDMIISGGENIHPEEVENILSECDLVSQSAVVGLTDERMGQKVVAFIEPQNGNVDEEKIDTHCINSKLARFKRPRQYIFVEQLPRSASGKLLRRQLREGNYTALSENSNIL
tara:strand:+ start:2124 stop:3671 length:1548 start_codon:yes stop_codon:yes gene_type:complete